MAHENRAYLWLDMETTGDRPTIDEILEIGWFFTNHQLDKFDHAEGNFYCLPFSNWEELMIPVVAEMHEKNGLAEAIRTGLRKKSGLRLTTQIETVILRDIEIINENYGATEFVLAGSGISQLDMPFIKRWMPKLASKLAYFMLDIGQVRRFLRDVAGIQLTESQEMQFDLVRQGAHRAYADALAHWQEAKFWVDVLRDLQCPSTTFTLEDL